MRFWRAGKIKVTNADFSSANE
jgi:hypothetical protein